MQFARFARFVLLYSGGLSHERKTKTSSDPSSGMDCQICRTESCVREVRYLCIPHSDSNVPNYLSFFTSLYSLQEYTY